MQPPPSPLHLGSSGLIAPAPRVTGDVILLSDLSKRGAGRGGGHRAPGACTWAGALALQPRVCACGTSTPADRSSGSTAGQR